MNVLSYVVSLVIKKVDEDMHHGEHKSVDVWCLEDHHSASREIVGGVERYGVPQRQSWRLTSNPPSGFMVCQAVVLVQLDKSSPYSQFCIES